MAVWQTVTQRFSGLGRWPILTLLTGILLLALGVQAGRLVLAAITDAGPLGSPAPRSASPSADAVAAKFDPFFASAPASGPGVVTALPLKLFGTRIDFAGGRGSAIIATPDGIQQSFSVGETIMPGAKLASVAGDHVEIERNGTRERLYIDQSVPAAPAAPAPQSGQTPPSPMVAPPPPVITVPPAAKPADTSVQQTPPNSAAEQSQS